MLYILLLHGLIFYLAFEQFGDQMVLFIGIELGLVLSILCAYGLYRGFIKPQTLLETATENLRSKDFGIKLVASSTAAHSRVEFVQTYNALIEYIARERKDIQSQHYFLESMIQVSPLGIIIMDYEDRVTDFNASAMRICQLSRKDVGKTLVSSDKAFLRQLGQLSPSQSKVLKLLGDHRYKCRCASFIHRGFPRKFIFVEELSEELRAAEKQTYGQLIRMMAHEVNNSIAAINSILETTLEVGFGPEDQDLVESLQIAIERNRNLNSFMQNLADLVRIPEPQLAKVELTTLVRRCVQLSESLYPQKNIKWLFDLGSEPLWVMADAALLEQAFINIYKNSAEAIEEEGIIKTSIDRSIREIQIVDTGSGISPTSKEHLFSPFYSSKPQGQGVGLVLIKEILLGHHWPFSLYTQEVEGKTYFQIQYAAHQEGI